MKKLIPAVVLVLVIGACLPGNFPIPATATAGVQATSTIAQQFTQTQSLPIQPTSTSTLAPLNPTVTPVLASSTPQEPATITPQPDLTLTLVTATEFTASSATPTPNLPPGAPTLTPTLGVMLYGTLPPAVPFNRITLWNRSKVQAYISLQVTTNDGQFSVLEYPVEGQMRIKAPLGKYVYVAWVGGNKMTGSFRLSAADSLLITLFKDKVIIN